MAPWRSLLSGGPLALALERWRRRVLAAERPRRRFGGATLANLPWRPPAAKQPPRQSLGGRACWWRSVVGGASRAWPLRWSLLACLVEECCGRSNLGVAPSAEPPWQSPLGIGIEASATERVGGRASSPESRRRRVVALALERWRQSALAADLLAGESAAEPPRRRRSEFAAEPLFVAPHRRRLRHGALAAERDWR